MAGSVVLNTAIGLIFVFLTASLICSGILEYISKVLNKRGDYLLRGLRERLDIPPATPGESSCPPPSTLSNSLSERSGTRQMLNRLATAGAQMPMGMAAAGEGTFTPAGPLADLVLAHPVVASLHRPSRPGQPVTSTGGLSSRMFRRRKDMHIASYLSAQTFATALLDLFVPDATGKTSPDRIRKVIEKLDKNIPGRAALLALLRDAEGDADRFRKALEHWYDEQMARVSGWYKRWAQWRLFVAGALLAVLMNVNSLGIAQTLYRDEPVRNVVVSQAVAAEGCPAQAGEERQQCLANQRTILRDLPLPLGWGIDKATADCKAYNQGKSCVSHPWLALPFVTDALSRTGFVTAGSTVVGWLLTGAAVSFGAPFWFDALSKLGSLRTAGQRPGPASGDAGGTSAQSRSTGQIGTPRPTSP